ncbi:pyruvate dehydrogenase [Sphingobacterium alkalisoli]|uniref:Dihydrolipoamide acetyltransferase component of pyruvate dehydrogenase complex n=1 Tax=Sphingobacterium alkalisoli TaxID=1874115 RepID=A0A4U0H8Y6_9SPHI|nr:dihydrolipoamide acetyltransferase family protein [Sphingobacterium alkalisoli]TJY68291.1 pyruvate dehydrogenase [Sphingobacterium alkalisoli]GGH07547.1 dihydrolipoamide acetyltransferase component of pyruvate dehydrogenase complex [Sphingobacterium alkalisoli]
MAEVVKMPKMSDTMTEGVIAKWHKKVGDKVNSGDLVAEIETDKATMDFESYQEGTLLYIGPKEGEAVAIDAIIAILGEEGEAYEALLTGESTTEAPKDEQKKEDGPSSESKSETDDTGKTITPEELDCTVITMPLLSDTMKEGVIAQWNFKVGDTIKSDDAIADVETDKATMEVTAYADGTLLYVGLEAGEAAKVNDIIAIVGPAGTDVTPLLNQKPAPVVAAEEKSEAKEVKSTSESSSVNNSSSSDDSRVKASPLARKIAKDKGINLDDVKGSADGGRIVKKDVESFVPTTKAAPSQENTKSETKVVSIPQYVGEERYTEANVSQMRKTIARRLGESLFTAPHFYLTVSIDMDNAIAARAQINDVAPGKVSFNDIVIKAVAIALKQHLAVNSSWQGDKIRFNEHTNIGVAMAVEDGLLVPVVRFADGKSLSHISAEVKDFAQKAKSKKLQPSDWEGSTFTVSNLGMFGIDEFTSIINSPDGAILSVGAIQQVPVVKNGAVVPGNIMKLTLGCDHRVVDGATGAQFLQTLKGLLEAPIRLLA